MIFLRRFWKAEVAQDLIEYTLLIAFVVLGTAALMSTSGGSVSRIWTATNVALTGQVAPPANGGGGGDHDHDDH
jgi:Flp pilus assembly pilin Flp